MLILAGSCSRFRRLCANLEPDSFIFMNSQNLITADNHGDIAVPALSYYTMKICLVTSFPPSQQRLNEYGYHLACELQRDPYLSLTVLADHLEKPADELPEFDVERCWSFNSLRTVFCVLKALREHKPDVVWFNLVFSSFGDRPLPAFLGLCIPALSRLLGYYTHITLHHLMEDNMLEDAGVRWQRLYSVAGWIATRILLLANAVSVLLPLYRRTLVSRYRGNNVHLRAHGVFSPSPEYPDFSRRGDPRPRILAIGKWGTYKRLELLLKAFPAVRRAVPEALLVIAGADHPMTPGYLAAVRRRYQGEPGVVFSDYVAEKDLQEMFATASLLAMPYTSASGPSGVAHQACQFGLPIVSADIAEFRDMAEEEGIAIEFYRTGDAHSLAEALISVLRDPERQREMAEINFSAAVRMTMPEIIRQYLRSFERERKIHQLRPRRTLVARRWSSAA